MLVPSVSVQNSLLVILIILVIPVTRNNRHTFAAGESGYSLFMRRISCAPLCGGPAYYRHSPRTELLLIYRIQSHTHPKRRKFCLKHAGQKSSKEELAKQRKGPKRA